MIRSELTITGKLRVTMPSKTELAEEIKAVMETYERLLYEMRGEMVGPSTTRPWSANQASRRRWR